MGVARCYRYDESRKTEVTRTGERASEATEPPWNMVLHNDRNPINQVVWRMWRSVSGMTMRKATRVTWEVSAGFSRYPVRR